MSGTLTPSLTTDHPAFGGTPLRNLRAAIRGQVSTPLDADWDDARRAWALAVDQRPALVVRPVDIDDVRQAIRFAAAHGLQVAPQGTGHNPGPLGDLQRTMLIRTDLMREVTIDAAAMTARVAAGAVWGDVTPLACVEGLVALAGSSHDVGVVGYTLGGGVSWLARSHGLAANSVTAIEIVTPDGELRRVDDTHDSELFWALRGGGGSFGVVTAIEFRLYPMTTVHAGALFWPIDRAADVMHAWREWTEDLPASVMSVARVMSFPDIPDIPAPLSGRSFVVVEAVIQDAAPVADAFLADLRRLEPEIDTMRPTPVGELSALHMDPPGPAAGVCDGGMLRDVTAATIEALLAVAAGERGRPLMSVELRHLGGALAPGRGEGGVVSGLDGAFLFFAGGMVHPGQSAATVDEALDELAAALDPWRSDMDYVNFRERPTDARRFFGGDVDRLLAAKRRVDPDGLMRANHPVDRRA